MDKQCKRCNFRTPEARKICQVCGHTQFHRQSAWQSAGDRVTGASNTTCSATPEPAINPTRALPSLLGNLCQATRQVLSEVSTLASARLGKAGGDETGTVEAASNKRLPKRPSQTVTEYADTYISSLPKLVSTDLDSQRENLNQLLAWFESYGADQPLIVSRTDSHEPANKSQTKKAA